MEKRRCKNCGAFLGEEDKVCYVCGEVQLPDVVTSENNSNDETRVSSMSFEKDEDFVVPAESHEREHTDFEDRVPYGDEDIAEPYYEMDAKRERAQKKRGKKALIITIICVLAAAAIGAVCFCVFNGVFDGGKKTSEKYTIYFDKPDSDIDLITSDGKIYNWSNDVEVSYIVNDKTKTKICTPCSDHDSLWEVKLPVKATSIYFYESEEKGMRTQVLPSFENEIVYYVSQEAFNAQNQLPLGECERDAFEGIGVNYATTAETSASSSTEETTKAEDNKKTTKATEETTKDENDSRKKVDNGTYTVELPKTWQSGVSAVENGNCISYYEDYNYKMYYMGKLASIYVFDADDSEADNLSGVKDIRYNSDQTKKIVITTPTDVQFNEADEKAQKNYLEKNKDLNSFLDSISVE